MTRRQETLCIAFLGVLFAGVAIYFSLVRHWELKSILLDLGVFDQALWTFMTEGVPTNTINIPHNVHHWLGFHFSPIVLGVLPIYWLFPHAETLLVLQPVIVYSALIPIALSAQIIEGERANSRLLWCFVFCMNPFVANGLMFDFHEIAFAVPIMAWALYALLAGRFWLILSFCLLLCLCKEHYGVSLIGFGMAWSWRYKNKTALIQGTTLALLGGVIACFILLYLMPALHQGQHAMMGNDGSHLGRYSWIKGDISELPSKLFPLLMHPSELAYVVLLLLPFLFLPLAALFLLLPAGADIAANMLALNSMPRNVLSYHSMAVIPCVILAGCYGLAALKERWQPMARFSLLLITLFIGWGLSPFPLPFARNLWQVGWEMETPPTELYEIRSLAEPHKRLSIQGNIGAYFSQRKYIYPFPAMLDKADMVILHLKYPYTEAVPANNYFGNPYKYAPYIKGIRSVLADPDFGVTYWQNNWLVLERNAKNPQPKEGIKRRVDELDAYFRQSEDYDIEERLLM